MGVLIYCILVFQIRIALLEDPDSAIYPSADPDPGPDPGVAITLKVKFLHFLFIFLKFQSLLSYHLPVGIKVKFNIILLT